MTYAETSRACLGRDGTLVTVTLKNGRRYKGILAGWLNRGGEDCGIILGRQVSGLVEQKEILFKSIKSIQ